MIQEVLYRKTVYAALKTASSRRVPYAGDYQLPPTKFLALRGASLRHQLSISKFNHLDIFFNEIVASSTEACEL